MAHDSAWWLETVVAHISGTAHLVTDCASSIIKSNVLPGGCEVNHLVGPGVLDQQLCPFASP